MKYLNSLLAVSLGALMFVGCAKDSEPTKKSSDKGTKSITISVNGSSLVRALPDDAYATEADIQKLDIYFTSAADVVKYVYSVNASATGDDLNAWNDLTGKKGVRFIGLENVSRVYVVANAAETPAATGANLQNYLLELENYAASVAEGNIAYVGGDKDITPIADEDAPGVTTEITLPGAGEKGSQYYTANVAIRPVISRLEIGSISVVTDGETTIAVDNNGVETNYTVSWTGFKPTLTGVYMSNFYQSENPLAATVNDLFATPAKMDAIAEGKFTGLTYDNQQGLAVYSNYTTAYQPLFTAGADLTATAGVSMIWTGLESNKCVPFNFLVPYDVYATATDAVAAAASMAATPVFHFQFLYPAAEQATYEITVTDADGEEVTGDLYYQIVAASQLTYPQTADNIAYANVVKFFDASENEVTIEPSKIYRMKEVRINPFNLTSSTTRPEDTYNVVVIVEVVDFAEIDVTPGFE